MNSEYPNEQQLDHIKSYQDFSSIKGIRDFLEYIENLWHWPDWGFLISGKRVIRLELHTGGWSGNEDVIQAMGSNYIFWCMYWRKSTAGGHYWFRIKLPKGEKKCRKSSKSS